MAQILPFKGILYNNKKIKKPAKVVTPPYDVISEDMQNQFYKAHENNIVKLILPKDSARSSANKYKKVKLSLDQWIKKDILTQDEKPHIYICSEEYMLNGEIKKRFGIFCRVKLEEFKNKKVLPHEHIVDKPMRDRLKLIKTVKANLSPIFSIYSDSFSQIDNVIQDAVKNKHPYCEFPFQAVKVRLWKISDTKLIEEITVKMKTKKLFIADGHHRYQAALLYKNQMQARSAKKQDCDYVMMYLVSSDSSGLSILPTHRVIEKAPNCSEDHIIHKLSPYFEIIPMQTKKDLTYFLDWNKNNKWVFGLYLGKSKGYLLKLVKPKKLFNKFKAPYSLHYRQLDVYVLHGIIFDNLLGWKDKLIHHKNLLYTSQQKQAFKLVDEEKAKAAFLLNPTRMEEVKDVALKGEKMPQKSTFFYPKIVTGLVINRLGE